MFIHMHLDVDVDVDDRGIKARLGETIGHVFVLIYAFPGNNSRHGYGDWKRMFLPTYLIEIVLMRVVHHQFPILYYLSTTRQGLHF